MANSHIQGFFGQNVGIIIKSPSSSKPYIIFQCIKKKANGIWEKTSFNEGKTVKFSLEEIVMILQVLNHKMKIWKTVHSYKKKITQISFSREERSPQLLWININNYSKLLNFAQVEILRLLLSHLLDEKIIYATAISKSRKYSIKTKIINGKEKIYPIYSKIHDEIPLKVREESFTRKIMNNIIEIEGLIKEESNKAILINFNTEQDIWIPKSAIHSHYYPRKNILQNFSIESWILRKNNLFDG